MTICLGTHRTNNVPYAYSTMYASVPSVTVQYIEANFRHNGYNVSFFNLLNDYTSTNTLHITQLLQINWFPAFNIRQSPKVRLE